MPAVKRVCATEGCTQRLPPDAAPNRKYHDDLCREKTKRRNYRARVRAREMGDPIKAKIERLADRKVGPSWVEENARRGPLFEKLLATPSILHPLLDGTITYADAGEQLGCSAANIQRMMIALRQDALTEKDREVWELAAGPARLLGPPIDDAPERGTDAWEGFLRELTDRFVEWRDTYMVDEWGNRYFTLPFHREWIAAVLNAIYTGNRQMILSPPRHGKTQLLIDFCTWLICRDAHVRIIWVAANGDLAEDWCQAIQDQLESNEKLRADYLPPGVDWKPAARSGKSWSKKQFKVGTRTRVVKSPTMQAVGRGGKILSRDVDFMIVDDIEDHGSTIQPGTRDSTRKWFAQDTGSRKEDHTGVVVIGSRQHPDDLYGHLIDNDEWDTIVEEAHDSACDLDPLDEDIHTGCMLFPEKRSYPWLMGQKRSFAITGGETLWLMVYQNVAMDDGLIIFDPDEMKKCRTGRGIGDYPPGLELVAGLDPATAGYQAAVLWGYSRSTGLLYLIDIANDLGAGIPGWRDTLLAWYEKYKVTHWVIEENGAQSGYLDDFWVQRFKATRGIHLEGHQTQGNKWDKYIGVTAMARLFNDTTVITNPTNGQPEAHRIVDLPYGTPAAKAKIDAYIKQAVHFSTAASQNRNTRSGYKSDIVMASWFPMKAIRRMSKERQAQVEYDYTPAFGELAQLFAGNDPPWGRMTL
jgi:hypothetical protein